MGFDLRTTEVYEAGETEWNARYSYEPIVHKRSIANRRTTFRSVQTVTMVVRFQPMPRTSRNYYRTDRVRGSPLVGRLLMVAGVLPADGNDPEYVDSDDEDSTDEKWGLG